MLVMDAIYFVREGENEELRYSLRTIKNLNPSRVWVVGGKPDWYSGNYIPVNQLGTTKWDRVQNMYRLICNNKDISDDFILMNDDFYIMKPWAIRPAHRGTLAEHIIAIEQKYGDRPTPYTMELRRCRRLLEGLRKPLYSFELHIPTIFNKKRLEKLLGTFPDIHATRSLYYNYYYNELGEIIQMDDVKVLLGTTFDPDSTLLSSEDDSWALLKDFIHSKFPNKSEYEND